MSTAILPGAASGRFGYITGMELGQILAWVDVRMAAVEADRKAAGKRTSDAAISKEAGHPDMIRNMRRGTSRPKIAALRALAKVLGEPPEGLFDEPPQPPGLPTVEQLEAELVVREAELASLQQQADELKITISVLKARRHAS